MTSFFLSSSSLGICEEYIDRRLPMTQLSGRPEKFVLRYFCKKYSTCYAAIISRLSIEYSMNAHDDFIRCFAVLKPSQPNQKVILAET